MFLTVYYSFNESLTVKLLPVSMYEEKHWSYSQIIPDFPSSLKHFLSHLNILL